MYCGFLQKEIKFSVVSTDKQHSHDAQICLEDVINCCSTAVLALLREWHLFLCPGEFGDPPGAQHFHPGMTVALAVYLISHLSDWWIEDGGCKMLQELHSAERVNISITTRHDTVQTPTKYPYIYVGTNPTKPLRNSSVGFKVSPAVGIILLIFFLPYPILLRHQSVPWELYLKARAAEPVSHTLSYARLSRCASLYFLHSPETANLKCSKALS